jgi:hypothetical protein
MPSFQWEWSWQTGPMPQPWFSICMAACAIGLLSVSAYLALSMERFLSTALHVQGTVIDIKRDARDGRLYPVVAFKDHDGNEHLLESNVRRSAPAYRKNERVTVVYPRESPMEARVEKFTEMWLLPLVLALMGIAFGVGSALTWRFRRGLFPQYRQTPDKSAKQTRRNGRGR